MSIESVSALNRGWGICGFASAIGALYQSGVVRQTIKQAVARHQLMTRLLAEIKSYLVTLQSENSGLIGEIEVFTRTFGPKFASFTVQGYIAKINSIGGVNPSCNDSLFSVAMPPDAVVDYLHRAVGLKRAQVLNGVNQRRTNVIIGLGTGTGLYDGLKHWVYRQKGGFFRSGKVINYGMKEELSATLKNTGLQIVCQIGGL